MFQNGEAPQSQFFDRFEKDGDSTYIAYLQVRRSLLDAGLITFRPGRDGEKIISLTDKGKLFLTKIDEIERLV